MNYKVIYYINGLSIEKFFIYRYRALIVFNILKQYYDKVEFIEYLKDPTLERWEKYGINNCPIHQLIGEVFRDIKI
jgi:hypothetical protein